MELKLGWETGYDLPCFESGNRWHSLVRYSRHAENKEFTKSPLKLRFPQNLNCPPFCSTCSTAIPIWIFRGMSITHSEVKPIICSEANRSRIPRHADQPFRGQTDQKFAAVGMN